MDEKASSREAQAKPGERTEQLGIVEINKDVGGDDEVVLSRQDLRCEVMRSCTQMGNHFRSNIDCIHKRVTDAKRIKLVAFQREIVTPVTV